MFRTAAQSLDPTDVELLREVQTDCKTPLAQLGERVGLSAPAVMKRLRKLEQAGVIRGYQAVLDGRSMGLDVTAFVGLSINFPKNIDEFTRFVQGLDGVLECHHVTGRHSLLLKVKAPNTSALEGLIAQLQHLDAVERTETTVVLSTRKELTAVPLDHLGVNDNAQLAGHVT